MKSFADIKRRFALGVVLECVENTYRPEINGTLRRIEKVQTNAIACTAAPGVTAARGALFWTPFPKASGVKIIDADTFQFDLGLAAGHHVTLRFVKSPT